MTPGDIDAFAAMRFAGPFRAFSTEQMAGYRERIDRDVLSKEGPDPNSRVQSRHLDSEDVLRICTAPAIVDRVAALLGETPVLWRSNFFEKPPGAPLFDWHRDGDIWGSLLAPMINVSAWIAIESASAENACVEVAPPGPDGSDDVTAARAMELAPGEFFLFDDTLLHRSAANGSSRRRLGLAARFTRSDVAVDATRLFPGYRAIDLTSPGGR